MPSNCKNLSLFTDLCLRRKRRPVAVHFVSGLSFESAFESLTLSRSKENRLI